MQAVNLKSGVKVSFDYPKSETGENETRTGEIEAVTEKVITLKFKDGSFKSFSHDKITSLVSVVQ